MREDQAIVRLRRLLLFQEARAFTVLVGKIHLEEVGRAGKGGKID